MTELIYEPAVYVVGRQQVIAEELARFLRDEGVPEWSTDTDIPAQVLPEVAGRLCYLSFKAPRPGGNEAYLSHILESRHGSVCEHAIWSVIITGVSRSFSHEMVRHRLFSYSQLSQRFVDESECRFVVPPALSREVRLAVAYRKWTGGGGFKDYWQSAEYACEGDPTVGWDEFKLLLEDGSVWLDAVEYAQGQYELLVEALLRKVPAGLSKTDARKWARQAARSVLPNATETKLFVTGNARSWRHFIEMRAAPGADVEIRSLAVAVYRRLLAEAPNLFSDYDLVRLPDGTEGLTPRNPKV